MIAVLTMILISGSGLTAPQEAGWVVPPNVEAEIPFPEFARTLELDGYVRLDCAGDETGRLVDCRVISATPEGLGFGQAAVTIAQTGRVLPSDGESRRYQFGVPLRLADVGYPNPVPFKGKQPSRRALELGRELTSRLDMSTMISETIPSVDLGDDRRSKVQGWVEELFPTRERLVEIVSIVFARRYSETELEDLIAGRPTPASDRWPADVEILAEAVDMFDWRAATRSLRDRYCAEYDCRQP